MSYAGSWPNPFRYSTGGRAPYDGRSPPVSTLDVSNPPPSRSSATTAAIIAGIFAVTQTYQAAFAFVGGGAPFEGRPAPVSSMAGPVVNDPPFSRLGVTTNAIVSGLFTATQAYQSAFAFVGGNAPFDGRQAPVSTMAAMESSPPHVTISVALWPAWPEFKYSTGGGSPYAARVPPILSMAINPYRPRTNARVNAGIISGIFAATQSYQSGFAFVGGGGPYEGRQLPPSLVAVQEDNPPYVPVTIPQGDWRTVMPHSVFNSRGRRIPPDDLSNPVSNPPHATMQVPMSEYWRPVMPSEVFRGLDPNPALLNVQVDDPPVLGLPPTSFDAIYASWRAPYLIPLLPRFVPEAVADPAPLMSAGRVNMPVWPAPDRTVALSTKPVLNPGLMLEFPPINNPPILSPPNWWTSVAASWVSPAPPPDQSRRLPNLALLNIVVDDPPIAPPLPRWWSSVAAAWTRPVHQAIVAPPVVPRPLVITPIAGGTASTYVPVAGDVGARIFVTVVATNAAGSSLPATSDPVGPVVP